MKGRGVSSHLLPAVYQELDRIFSKGHIKKLDNSDEGKIFSLIVITCKKPKSKMLALGSKLIKKQLRTSR